MLTEQDLINKQERDIFSFTNKDIAKVDLAPIQYTAPTLKPLDMQVIDGFVKARDERVSAGTYTPENTAQTNNSVGLSGLSDKIIKYAKEYGATDQQTAYMLATAKHESNFANIGEKGDDNYLSSYVGKLGNVTKEDAIKYKGRGVVQITGKSNYERFGKMFGVDLVGNPDLILKDDDLAVKILVKGSLEGFTGKGLGNYKTYKEMRQAINGDMEKNGDKIAAYATEYEKLLKKPTQIPISQGAVKTQANMNYTDTISLKNSSGLWTNGTPFDVSEIDFVGSVQGGRISSGQEWRKQAGRGAFNLDPKTGLQMNTGLDIAAPTGSAIKMPTGFQSAEVISAGATSSGSGYGNQFVIKMTNKNGQIGYWQGSHLQGLNVKVGQKLSAGQQIATVGATGNVTGSHLDAAFYTINTDGKKVYQKIA